ncbi:MAG: plasmid pRiA4b ORF-3 family protein [Sphingobacteriaceae bacterium]|nr:plasmid pRiA4b ORF-3 family protein [Sphingobacteriaceae bacterium]
MAVYRFKISFEDYDEVIREIDIKTTQTFEDLHKALHISTGYNVEKSSSFYVSTDNWLKGDEIAYLPNERKIQRGVALMEKSRICDFIEDPHQKFYYIYNFERQFDFHVELIKIILEDDAKTKYPTVFKSIGEAPKIYDRTNIIPVDEEEVSTINEFDFLNELNFVPEDVDLEALENSGINSKSSPQDDEEDEYGDEDMDSEFDEDEEYGSSKDEDY